MYLLISITALVVSFVLFKKVAGRLKLTQLNMISWLFFYSLIIQSFIASVLIVHNIDNQYMINKLNDENSRIYGWLAVQYTLIMMPLGMLFVVRLFGYKHNNRIFQKYVHSDIVPFLSIKDTYIRYPLYLLSFIAVLSVIYVMLMLKTIPITGIIQGLSSEALGLLRQSASRGFPGNEYVKNILALGLTPILAYISFSYYKMTKSKFDLIWFFILLIVTFLILSYNIAKSPFIEFLLGLLFLNILINGSIKKKTLFIFFGSALLMFVFLYFVISKVTDFSLLFSYNHGIGGRVLLTQAAGNYLSFDLFPNTVEHIGFSSMSGLLSSILDVTYVERSSRLLMENYFHSRIVAGTGGVINSLFIAEAWANFGLVGVLIAPFYVGVVIQTLFMFFLTMPKTPLVLGLFALFSYKGGVMGGFNNYIYNPGFTILALIFVLVYFTGLFFKQRKKNND